LGIEVSYRDVLVHSLEAAATAAAAAAAVHLSPPIANRNGLQSLSVYSR